MHPSDTLLLETIKIERGIVHNLPYHQTRFNKSRAILFNTDIPIDLLSVITPPSDACYRCRILYGRTIEKVEYLPYTPKPIRHLKIVSSSIDYSHKYADRSCFEELLKTHPEADEILIEKEGYLTDTTISNIAFFDGKTWVTPETPLLQGTMRQKLLDNGTLITEDIRKEDLGKYTHVALMNAMLGFKILNQITIA